MSVETGRNIIKSVIGNAAAPLSALISLPLLANALGPAGRGEVAAATSPVLLAVGVATLGLPESATVHVARDARHLRYVLKKGLLAILLAGVGSNVIIVVAARFLLADSDSQFALMTYCSLAVIPNLLLSVVRGAASGLHRWNLVNAEKLIGATTRLLGLTGLLLLGSLDAFNASLLIALGPLVAGAVYLRIARESDVDDGALPAPQLYSFGLRVWFGAVSGVLLARLDQVLMVPLSSEFQLGLYAVAVSIADLPILISSATRDVTLSSDAAVSSQDRMELSARATLLSVFLVCALLGSTLDWWLAPIFGRDFIGLTIPVLVLLTGAVVGAPGSVAGAALTARGYPQLRSIGLLMAVVGNVALLLVLVPQYGATGASVATLFGLLVFSFWNLYCLRSRCGIMVLRMLIPRPRDLTQIMTIIRRN